MLSFRNLKSQIYCVSYDSFKTVQVHWNLFMSGHDSQTWTFFQKLQISYKLILVKVLPSTRTITRYILSAVTHTSVTWPPADRELCSPPPLSHWLHGYHTWKQSQMLTSTHDHHRSDGMFQAQLLIHLKWRLLGHKTVHAPEKIELILLKPLLQ